LSAAEVNPEKINGLAGWYCLISLILLEQGTAIAAVVGCCAALQALFSI